MGGDEECLEDLSEGGKRNACVASEVYVAERGEGETKASKSYGASGQ